jgi:hypothetical protein
MKVQMVADILLKSNEDSSKKKADKLGIKEF